MTEHQKNCEAAICVDDINSESKNNVVWYAGEEVCKKEPYGKIQKKQLAINKDVKSGMFRQLKTPYNAHQLETQLI